MMVSFILFVVLPFALKADCIPGDLIQAIVRVFPQQSRLTYTNQDSCTTEEGMETIAAGVSELGAETTVKIWVFKPVPLSSPAPTLVFEPRPIEVSVF